MTGRVPGHTHLICENRGVGTDELEKTSPLEDLIDSY